MHICVACEEEFRIVFVLYIIGMCVSINGYFLISKREEKKGRV